MKVNLNKDKVIKDKIELLDEQNKFKDFFIDMTNGWICRRGEDERTCEPFLTREQLEKVEAESKEDYVSRKEMLNERCCD